MAKKNPFEVLGFSKKFVREKSDVEIRAFARAVYKQFAMLYHPDRNPDDPSAKKRFQEFAAAYDVIQDDTKLAHFKQRYSKREPFSKQREELETERDQERERADNNYRQLVDNLIAFSSARDPFNIAPAVISVQDLAKVLRVSLRNDGTQEFQRQYQGKFFYDLVLRKNGSLEKRRKEGRKTPREKLEGRALIGVVPYETVQRYGSTKAILELAQNIWTPFDEKDRLLGIKKSPVKRYSGDVPIDYFENRMSIAGFKPIMELIEPRIELFGLLFSLNYSPKDENGNDIEPYFSVEGPISRIVSHERGIYLPKGLEEELREVKI